MGKAKRDGTEGTGASGGNGSMAATIDRELVSAALRKRQSGLQPSVREMAALRRFEAQREEELRWRHYASIPQKHWAKMSGRQWKVLREQAELYGIPFADDPIDLPRVVRALHDFFAKHFRKFAAPKDGEDELLAGASKSVRDEYVRQKTRIEKIKADQLEEKAIYYDALQPRLIELGTELRRAGDILQRNHGPEALAVLEEVLDEFDRKVAGLTDQGGRSTRPNGDGAGQE